MSWIKTPFKGLYRLDKGGAVTYRGMVRVGKKQYKKTFRQGITVSQALEELEKFRNSLKKYSSDKTFEQLFEWYIEHVSPFQSPQTIRTKKSNFKKNIAPLLGKIPAWKVLPNDIQHLAVLLLEKLSPKTVKHIVDLISSMYSKANKMGIMHMNPAQNIDLPKYDNRRKFSLNKMQTACLLKAISTFPEELWRRLFMFLLHGRRLNEVLSMEWSQVNLNNGIYEIPYKHNKTRRLEHYQFADYLLVELREHYQLQMSESGKLPKGIIFKSPRTGEKIKDVRKAWGRIKKKWASLLGEEPPAMRIHDFRHLVGDIAVNILGMPIEKVSHALGHTDIKTTQIYVNKRASSSKSVIESIWAKYEEC